MTYELIPATNIRRDISIIRDFINGTKVKELTIKHDITTERIRQIIFKFNRILMRVFTIRHNLSILGEHTTANVNQYQEHKQLILSTLEEMDTLGRTDIPLGDITPEEKSTYKENAYNNSFMKSTRIAIDNINIVSDYLTTEDILGVITRHRLSQYWVSIEFISYFSEVVIGAYRILYGSENVSNMNKIDSRLLVKAEKNELEVNYNVQVWFDNKEYLLNLLETASKKLKTDSRSYDQFELTLQTEVDLNRLVMNSDLLARMEAYCPDQ